MKSGTAATVLSLIVLVVAACGSATPTPDTASGRSAPPASAATSATPVGLDLAALVGTWDGSLVDPSASIEEIIRIMREHAIRRVPVVQGDKPIGIVSIGDLARFKDPGSALAEISAAAPNN